MTDPLDISISGTVSHGVAIPQVHYGPCREIWERKEEREHTRYPIDKYLIGKKVHVTSVIVRAGYYWQHTDNDASMDFYTRTRDIAAKQVLETIPYSLKSSLSEEQREALGHQLVGDLERKWGNGIFYYPKREARSEWIIQVYGLPQYRAYYRLRTLWYISPAYALMRQPITITGKVARWIGKTYGPSGGGYDGEWDYDPGGFEWSTYQELYTALATFDMYPHVADDMPVLIHPLDVGRADVE